MDPRPDPHDQGGRHHHHRHPHILHEGHQPWVAAVFFGHDHHRLGRTGGEAPDRGGSGKDSHPSQNPPQEVAGQDHRENGSEEDRPGVEEGRGDPGVDRLADHDPHHPLGRDLKGAGKADPGAGGSEGGRHDHRSQEKGRGKAQKVQEGRQKGGQRPQKTPTDR